jgi:hypothetical protein
MLLLYRALLSCGCQLLNQSGEVTIRLLFLQISSLSLTVLRMLIRKRNGQVMALQNCNPCLEASEAALTTETATQRGRIQGYRAHIPVSEKRGLVAARTELDICLQQISIFITLFFDPQPLRK